MTTLRNLTNKQIIITRLTAVANTNKRIYATLTSALAEIQPTAGNKSDSGNGVMGKTFKLFLDPSIDVAEGDMLREVSTGLLFKVKTGGVAQRTQGSIDFIVAIIEQIN